MLIYRDRQTERLRDRNRQTETKTEAKRQRDKETKREREREVKPQSILTSHLFPLPLAWPQARR